VSVEAVHAVLTEESAMAPLHDIVELACRAPSVHNTQPWRWRLDTDRIELHADRERQLSVADPTGRNLVISCGAALHHAEVAAAASGFPASVTLLPDPDRPDHLATLSLTHGHRTPGAVADLRALEARRTDRRRFTSWSIPPERLGELAGSATSADTQVVPLIDAADRFRVELLVSRAMSSEAADPRYADEQRAWIDHSGRDGVPGSVLPTGWTPRRTRASRFDEEPVETPEVVEGTDGLLVIGTTSDDPMNWLRAGHALSLLWLRATTESLSVVPLSQVIEVEETRRALQHDVLGDLLAPQLLVRIGWQEISRRQLPRTPRRSVEEVLLP
jgi:hypothetical protein